MVAGYDGTNTRAVKTTTTGAVVVNIPDVIKIDAENRSVVVDETARENGDLSLLVSQTRSATPSSTALTLPKNKGLRLYLNVTAVPTSTTQTLTVKVSSVDLASSAKFRITNFVASPAANNSVYTNLPQLFVFDVYPGANATGLGTNYQSQSVAISKNISIDVVHSGTDPWTYSLGASALL